MIPVNIVNGYKIIKYPTKTYYFDIENKRIKGVVDGKKAMKQAIYKILMTERYEYLIYDRKYGTEIKDLFGKDVHIACAVLQRRIIDALTCDDRIFDVYDFEFATNKNTVSVNFTVATEFGEVEEDISINV
ncbi:MAG: DUF2634 domain-containing protein [Lachnospirales bacterium]